MELFYLMSTQQNEIPAASHPAQVCIKVKSLARTLPFYRDVVGWKIISKTDTSAMLSASGKSPAQFVLFQDENASDKPDHAVGLYHTAFRFPSRQDLANAIKRVAIKKYPFEGASDHIFSEAFYFSDPEGNGVEMYTDRPQEVWPRRDGKVQLIHSKALDIQNLLATASPGIPPVFAPENTDIGHIHLHVDNIEAAEKFFHEFLGMEIMYALPGARFLSAGGYHHHIAANVWAGAVAFPEKAHGLMSYRIEIKDQAYLDKLKKKAVEFGYVYSTDGGLDGVEVFKVKDPNGHWMELVVNSV